MGEDEQIQVQKDTVWELYQINKLIACLERTLEVQMEACGAIHDAWKGESLTVAGCRTSRLEGPIPDSPLTLVPLPNANETLDTVQRLADAKTKAGRLEKPWKSCSAAHLRTSYISSSMQASRLRPLERITMSG